MPRMREGYGSSPGNCLFAGLLRETRSPNIAEPSCKSRYRPWGLSVLCCGREGKHPALKPNATQMPAYQEYPPFGCLESKAETKPLAESVTITRFTNLTLL
jgi:hypothetical protein